MSGSDTEFTIDQLVAIRELERKLRRHSFDGAKAAMQSVYDGLVERARAFDEHRLFQVGCDWQKLIPYLLGVKRSSAYLYNGIDQLRGRLQGEVKIDFDKIELADSQFWGEHHSRKSLMLALIQTAACVLPPTILLAVWGNYWQKFLTILPDGHSILAWGTVFWLEEQMCVFGITREGANIRHEIFPITDETRDLSTEYVLLWKK